MQMKKTRVLLVDDERNVLRAWVQALRLAGLNVDTAVSGKEALAKCDEIPFDVVVVDFIMPQMSGVELLERIRKKLPFVRSIIVSGKIDGSVEEQDIRAQIREEVEADIYLHKPLSNERLIGAVSALAQAGDDKDWCELAERTLKPKQETAKGARTVSTRLRSMIPTTKRRAR